ncbi:hypothetical protein B0T14DRAFT_417295 [Immersiella caudata]|uniref:Uncharacterized protein n=1 Tax=Immersiella caudata TaxID=314043 RepID=A0AA40CCR5_9PEZI|nr:hypothetical protein B0T14DRAFT_417295 [Immersiella caudata]
MHLPQLFLGLAATASAIDIYLHPDGCCSCNSLVCVNAGPDWCCRGTSTDYFQTVSFRAIPTDWTIQGRGHSGGNCNNLRQTSVARNTRDPCLDRDRFSGAGPSRMLWRSA